MTSKQQGAICAIKLKAPTPEQAQCKEFVEGYEAVQKMREAEIRRQSDEHTRSN